MKPHIRLSLNQRDSLLVLLVLFWAPFWLGLGVIVSENWSVWVSIFMVGGGIAAGACWIFSQIYRATNRYERATLGFALGVIVLLSLAFTQGLPPEY